MGLESLALARRQHDALVNYRRIFELTGETAGLARRPAVRAERL